MSHEVREFLRGSARLPVTCVAVVRKHGPVGEPPVVGQPSAEAKITRDRRVAQDPVVVRLVMDRGPATENRVVRVLRHSQLWLRPFPVHGVRPAR